ncbi:hypothetical protein CONCODRAFT_9576 [Conidiobolus coronatus NRRL 28638]|uniref:Uncharacterized protein n=1 Tax=Conidiobolus coronatus (strain ATCC 28846 / CBS 209.66 / NRRL 28638) TaxID=796925 RepID=A0A137NZR5_CONC2|nr:hypothetical protein CONCODRAFT_9576 [Conidiobolus coronatus NRRL 28638]|eukprot:KXN68198.1 hypothetical protein CONCODRAFT_9576 [Conidiobolus coronatus NRRL 28638]
MRYAEFLAVTYGLDPEIKKITDTVEKMISDNLKWRNTKIQANLIVSGVCVATNKLYADGIDIELFHPLVEIMGMDLQNNVVDGVNYYHISPNAPTGEFVKRKPGLVGGIVNSSH